MKTVKLIEAEQSLLLYLLDKHLEDLRIQQDIIRPDVLYDDLAKASAVALRDSISLVSGLIEKVSF